MPVVYSSSFTGDSDSEFKLNLRLNFKLKSDENTSAKLPERKTNAKLTD